MLKYYEAGKYLDRQLIHSLEVERKADTKLEETGRTFDYTDSKLG